MNAVRKSRRSPTRSRALIVASNVYHNLATALRFRVGKVDSDIGATHAHWTTVESVAYVHRVLDDYRRFGGLDDAAIKERTILELGPGDNLGVALLLYARGAGHVIALDKFYARRDTERQRAVYAALRGELEPRARARFDDAIDLAGDLVPNDACLRYVYGIEAERADDLLGAASVDVVLSRAVIWEIHRIDETLQALTRVLRPGGRMIHKTACYDFVFRQHHHHPLEFLTVPEPVYRLMARSSGKCNRRTAGYYRRTLEVLGHDVRIHVVRVAGRSGPELEPGVDTLVRGVHFDDREEALVQEIRPRLRPEFRTLPIEDLLAEDLFVVTRKRVEAVDA